MLHHAAVCALPHAHTFTRVGGHQIAWRKGDGKTAKACMERHLKLAVALKDPKAQLDASEILGLLGACAAMQSVCSSRCLSRVALPSRAAVDAHLLCCRACPWHISMKGGVRRRCHVLT